MNKIAIEIFAYVVLALTASGASADTYAAYQPRLDGDGWEILFDGKNLDAWDYVPESGVWKIDAQGELYPAKPGSHIHSKRRYCDFVLEVDYKMAAKQKSNSGVFFRVHDAKDPVKTGMQMQILDNADYKVPFNADNGNGALYGLVRPAVDANVAIGQWNHCRITANANQIVIELNGKQIVKADLNQWTIPHTNPDGSPNTCPHVPDVVGALPREGFILLENYRAVPVWFRNIRIKPLTDRKPQYTGTEPLGDVLQKPAQPIGNVQLLPGGRFVVDGKPFLPAGMLYYPKFNTVADCKAHFINCLYVGLDREPAGVPRFEALLREAEKAGLKVIPYFGYGGWNEPNEEPPPWTEQQVRPYMTFRESRAIIGWVLGDDLLAEKHVPGVKSAAELLRRFDPGRPTLGDCDGRPPEDLLPFRPFLDIMLPYSYPVATDSFDQYVHALGLRRTELGDPVWTWVQMFNTKPTFDTFHIGDWGGGPFPQPEQLRLMSYLPFTCGYRGILYFGGHTMHTNPERAGEAAICCAELSLIGEVIAGGDLSSRARMAATYRADGLRTAAWEQGHRLLIIAMTRQADAHHYVGEAVFENFPIRATLHSNHDLTPGVSASVEVHAVSFPQLRPLPFTPHGRDAIDIQVDRLDVTEMYLVSDKGDPLVGQIKARMAEMLPAVAGFAVESATAELAKVQKTYERIAASDGATPAAESALAEARKEKQSADDALRSEQFTAAFTHARGSLRHCRQAGAACLKEAFDRAAKYGQTFYTLPEFYQRVKPIPREQAK